MCGDPASDHETGCGYPVNQTILSIYRDYSISINYCYKKYSQEYIRIYLRYSWLYFYLHLALYHSFYFPVIFIIRRFYSPIKRTLYLSYFISILNSLAAFSCGIFTARFPF